jgi:hypothetical protein
VVALAELVTDSSAPQSEEFATKKLPTGLSVRVSEPPGFAPFGASLLVSIVELHNLRNGKTSVLSKFVAPCLCYEDTGSSDATWPHPLLFWGDGGGICVKIRVVRFCWSNPVP